MSEHRDLERLLAAHLDATADPRPRPGQLDSAMARVAATSQRPAWAAAFTSDGRAAIGPDGHAALRLAALVAAAALLLAALLIGLLAGGRNELAVNPSPPASFPAVAIVPTPRPSARADASPSATAFVTPVGQGTDGPPCGQIDDLVTRIGATTGLAWGTSTPSPAGTAVRAGSIASWFANGAAASEVGLVDPTNGTQSTLLALDVALGRSHDLVWSPDGSALAIGFSPPPCGTLTFIRTSDGLVRLDPGPGFIIDEGSLSFSPDSTRLAVLPLATGQAQAPVGTHVWILPRDGGPKVDLGPPCPTCNTFGFAWSPDGRRLAGQYEAMGPNGAGTLGVAIADVAMGTWTVVQHPWGSSELGWRNNHEFLTESDIAGRTRIVASDALDGSVRVLPIDGDGVAMLLPDRRHVVTETVAGSGAATRTTIALLDLATGDRTPVWKAPQGIQLGTGMQVGSGILAPDGSALVIDGNRFDAQEPTDTWVIRLDGSGATKLAGVDINNGSWQPLVP